jgi:hypothetical protein
MGHVLQSCPNAFVPFPTILYFTLNSLPPLPLPPLTTSLQQVLPSRKSVNLATVHYRLPRAPFLVPNASAFAHRATEFSHEIKQQRYSAAIAVLKALADANGLSTLLPRHHSSSSFSNKLPPSPPQVPCACTPPASPHRPSATIVWYTCSTPHQPFAASLNFKMHPISNDTFTTALHHTNTALLQSCYRCVLLPFCHRRSK